MQQGLLQLHNIHVSLPILGGFPSLGFSRHLVHNGGLMQCLFVFSRKRPVSETKVSREAFLVNSTSQRNSQQRSWEEMTEKQLALIIKSQNHRIVELEGTLKGHKVQLWAMNRDVYSLMRLLKALCSLTLTVSLL